MGADQLLLFLGQATGLAKDRVRNGDLPDVMENRAPAQLSQAILVEAEVLAEEAGVGDDAARMASGLVVAGAEGRGAVMASAAGWGSRACTGM